MRVSPPESNPNEVGVWRFVTKVQKRSPKIANVRKNVSPSQHCRRSLPPPPSPAVPATDLPLTVFILSSFGCGQTGLFNFTSERWIPGLSPFQAELNTAPPGLKECVSRTLESRQSQLLQRERAFK